MSTLYIFAVPHWRTRRCDDAEVTLIQIVSPKSQHFICFLETFNILSCSRSFRQTFLHLPLFLFYCDVNKTKNNKKTTRCDLCRTEKKSLVDEIVALCCACTWKTTRRHSLVWILKTPAHPLHNPLSQVASHHFRSHQYSKKNQKNPPKSATGQRHPRPWSLNWPLE